jgi:nucleoid DNA-binding protein
MKKDDLVEALHKDANLPTKKQAQEIVEWFFDTITKALSRGEEVGITGFGTFKTAKRKAREGRNPQTGAKVQIAAKTVPKFSAGKLLKEAVK